jgi:hypothetical protein
MDLAELQAAVRRFVVAGDSGPELAAVLVGGGTPLRRLALHQRHYRVALTAALRQRFPATVWLVGSTTFDAVAARFIRDSPPSSPCMTVYGEAFPAFLGEHMRAAAPYVEDFVRLEWSVGRLAVAVGGPAFDLALLATLPDDLDAARCHVTSGVEYLPVAWPVHVLFDAFLREAPPRQFHLSAEPAVLEIVGARGEVAVRAVSAARAAFRTALADGAAITDADASARALASSFDLATELTAALVDGVVLAILAPPPDSSCLQEHV